jgi:dihydrofolate reductase
LTNYVYIATSLDGYIAGSKGNLDWLNNLSNPNQSDYGYSDFMKNIDAIVMGKNTFQKVLSFRKWPYHKPVFVLSNTLKEIPKNLTNKAKIINGDIKQINKDLIKQGFKNLYIDGGQTIQSFLKEDLIDEMIITTVPILLGDGIPLFHKWDQQLKLKHKNTMIYNNSLVKSHYIRDR